MEQALETRTAATGTDQHPLLSGRMTGCAAVDTCWLEDASWLVGDGADQGINYCQACAEKERENHGPDCFVDTGGMQEHDSPPQCENCGKPLACIVLDDEGTEINTEAEWLAYVQAND